MGVASFGRGVLRAFGYLLGGSVVDVDGWVRHSCRSVVGIRKEIVNHTNEEEIVSMIHPDLHSSCTFKLYCTCARP